MRVLIIDDEQAAIEVIKTLAEELASDIQVVGTAQNGVNAMQSILENKPDIIFLDVDMPLMNGVEMVKRIPNRNFEIIFTTGSDSYAFQAIKLEAIDYLLKPIDPTDFLLAVEKARSKLAHNHIQKNAIKIQIPYQHGIIYLEETSIVHITGMGSYCQIKTIDKKEAIVVSKNIGQLESMLSNRFFRCHNSQIINLDYVLIFSTKDGNSVIMKDGALVDVSRRSKETLLNRLSQCVIGRR